MSKRESFTKESFKFVATGRRGSEKNSNSKNQKKAKEKKSKDATHSVLQRSPAAGTERQNERKSTPSNS